MLLSIRGYELCKLSTIKFYIHVTWCEIISTEIIFMSISFTIDQSFDWGNVSSMEDEQYWPDTLYTKFTHLDDGLPVVWSWMMFCESASLWQKQTSKSMFSILFLHSSILARASSFVRNSLIRLMKKVLCCYFVYVLMTKSCVVHPLRLNHRLQLFNIQMSSNWNRYVLYSKQ